MQVVNATPLVATIVPNAEPDETIVALFVAALTCVVDAGGRLWPSDAQRPLILGPEKLEADDVQFFRAGVAITARGYVYLADGEGTAEAKLVVGSETRVVRAAGPRVWQPTLAGGLTPSKPLHVPRIEMSWDHTYGGTFVEPASIIELEGQPAVVPEHENGYPLNLDGMGFYLKPDQARDKPLPMLEHPDHLVKAWDDRPEPFCFAPYPLWGALRAQSIWDPGEKKIDLARLPRITGRACPRMTFDGVEPDTEISLTGMRPRSETIVFRVPDVPVYADVEIGDATARIDMALDAIDIFAEEREVRFVFRRLFRYGLVQMEPRMARFLPTQALEAMAAGRA